MHKSSRKFTSILGAASAAAFALATALPAHAATKNASFKEDIMPILEKHCSECHTPGGQGEVASGLDLTNYEGVMKGTQHGPVVVPGDAFLSNLMVLIEGRAGPELKMPHGRKDLTRWEKTLIRRWINNDALNN